MLPKESNKTTGQFEKKVWSCEMIRDSARSTT